MAVLSVLFVFLELVFAAIGVFIGYKRGTGKSLIRLIYLTALGVVSFLVGRAIALSISKKLCLSIFALVPGDYLSIAEKSPSLKELVANLVGGLLAVFTISLIFFILRLLSLICFNLISGKILRLFVKEEEPCKASRWIGAGIGFAYSIVAAAIILLPFFTPAYIASSIPGETVGVYVEAIAANFGDKQEAEELNTLITELKSDFNATKLFPISRALADAATTYSIPDTDETDSVTKSIPALTEVGSDALYVYNASVYNDSSVTAILCNTASAVTLHLDNSPTVKYVAACAVNAVGKIMREKGEFMGVCFAQTNSQVADEMLSDILAQTTQTTTENVKENMSLVFGTLNSNLLPKHKRDRLDVYFPYSNYSGEPQKGQLLIIYELGEI